MMVFVPLYHQYSAVEPMAHPLPGSGEPADFIHMAWLLPLPGNSLIKLKFRNLFYRSQFPLRGLV